MSSGPVIVCGGSDCAEDQRKAFRKLVAALDDAEVESSISPCLGVCHGPVVVVDALGRKPIVLQRLRKRKARDRFVARVAEGKRPKGGGGASVVSGKRAKKAARRSTKALRRSA